MKDQPKFRHLVAGIAVAAFAIVGCDEDKTRNAAEKAGEVTEKAVNAVGDASRDAAHTIGGAVEKAGDKMQDANDTTTRPASTRPTLP